MALKEADMEDNNPTNAQGSKLFLVLGVIILLIVGFIGVKVLVTGKSYKVILVDAPKEAETGKTTTFTWRIDGPPATINHTSVHYGTVSDPGEKDQKVKPEDTKYTDFVKDFASGDFNIPLQFVGNTMVSTSGTYYFRVHALIDGKNYWSDEYTLEVKPQGYSISFADTPTTAIVGQPVTFTWDINGPPTVVTSTTVRFGLESNPGVLGSDVLSQDTKYTNEVPEFMKGSYNIPFRFVGNVKIATEGAYFYRAHTVIDGKNIWSDEYQLEAK